MTTTKRHHERRRLALAWVAGWLALGILEVSQNLMQARAVGVKPDLRGAVGIPGIEMLFWALMTPAVLWIHARAPLRRGRLAASVAKHLVACVALSVLQSLISGPFIIALGLFKTWRWSYAHLLSGMVTGKLVQNVLTYAAIVAVAHGYRLWDRVRAHELDATRLEARLAEARLDVLRMQLQPHFLFNTLNAVSSLMRHDVAAADRVLTRLSDLLRLAMDHNDARDVSLRDEIEFLSGYLEIQKIRFGDRFRFVVTIDPAALDLRIPPLLLQPLVENAIRHGLKNRVKGGVVEVEARLDRGRLIVEVRDNGVGLAAAAESRATPWASATANGSEATAAFPGRPAGRGLANTRARLAYFYGPAHRFETSSPPAGGTVFRIEAPVQPADGSAAEAKA